VVDENRANSDVFFPEKSGVELAKIKSNKNNSEEPPMPSPLLRALSTRHGIPTLDRDSLDAFLADGAPALLFFAGDPAQRAETLDVAVILPELAGAFGGRLRPALIAASAEAGLMARFQVFVLPSLVVARAGKPVCVLPKIYDWPDYVARIEAALAPEAPRLASVRRARPEFTFVQKGASA
jgi:hydrogenase-1 operon protein HyaE